MEVRVARIDTCPTPSKIVGFTITHGPTGKSLYLDAFVPLAECDTKTEHDIAQQAWLQIKPDATHWIAGLDKKTNSIVGTILSV